MKRVFKYDAPVGYHLIIQMPRGAEILSLHVQRNVPRIWALVDPSAEIENRHFAVVATGDIAPDGASFVGTFLLDGGDLVFHLFEKAGGN